MNTQSTTSEIVLDGILNESIWTELPVAKDFIVNYPAAGTASAFPTRVQFTYDDEAIYIAAELDDIRPDSVLSILSQRDDFGNADWFGVLIDPYGSGQNGFGFYVTAAGVECDAIISQTDNDYSWNSIWKSRVVRTEKGWSLEMRIPLTQLRFPTKEIQTWKINFKRQVRRRREYSYWSPVDPQQYGELTQSGSLTGLSNLGNPLRLSFSPYSTAYLENFYNEQSGNQEWRFRPRFGMDVKLGLSESFTLDATVVPDFGQTVSDRLVLNLSPFEVRYAENRPFFLEGTDLFGIGDLFYSRRIGAETTKGGFLVDSLSQTGNTVESAPSQAQLVNATKLSGRTKFGLGIGIFNAVEKRSYVTYTDSSGNKREALAHPLTNYNVFVLSQNLKGNSNVSLVNTNVYRPDLNQFANVSGLESLLLTKNQKYSFFFRSQLSAIESGLGKSQLGTNSYAKFERVQGVYTYWVDYYLCSKQFDPNDLGFLPNSNFQGSTASLKWTGYEPKGRFLRRNLVATTNVEFLYTPSKFAYWFVEGRAIGTFKNFLTTGFEVTVFPIGSVDHFESRTFGIPVNFPASVTYNYFYSSDYSKKYALDFSISNTTFNANKMNELNFNVGPRVRFSDKLFSFVGVGVNRFFNDYGFVRVADTNYLNEIILGVRNRWIINNSISVDYTFTNRMGIQLRLNHYWQEVQYSNFRQLQQNGNTEQSTYTGLSNEGSSNHNTSYNAFTLDLNYRWVIFPGSEIRFVWKFNIYASKKNLDVNYFRTFDSLFDQPQLNSFSIRALFYLNAGKLRKR